MKIDGRKLVRGRALPFGFPPPPFPPFRVPFTFASPPLSENRLEIREFFLFFRYSPATPLQTKASCYLMCSSWAEAALKCHAPSLSDEAFVNAWEPRGPWNKDKSRNCGLRGSQNGGQTWNYIRLLYFLLNRAFLSVLRNNSAWTAVSHIFRNIFLEKYSTCIKRWNLAILFNSVAPTDRWIATYLCFKLLNSGDF